MPVENNILMRFTKGLKVLLLFLIAEFAMFTSNGQTITNVGQDFWVAFHPNFNFMNSQFYILVSSEYAATGTVSSVYPGVNQNFTVVPGTMTFLMVPAGLALSGGVESKGVHITTDQPVSVYCLTVAGASAGAYMALPVGALGKDYRVASYKLFNGTPNSNPARISVVAVQDNTSVTVFNHWTGATSTVTLNEGETWVSTDNAVSYQDVTGSRVQSDHPVVVFGSNDCVYIPDWSCEACDLVVEEMFPYMAWGKKFATVPLAGRDASGDIFRILSAESGNEIYLDGVLAGTIGEGDFLEATLTTATFITTSKAAMLVQYAKGIKCSGNITGDPLMMLIPPVDQFLTHYTIANSWMLTSHWVNLVAPSSGIGTIYEDNTLVPASAFTRIGTSDYYQARRQVLSGSHTFNSTVPFGVFVYGWTGSTAYGYPGGCSLSLLGAVQNIVLTPPVSSGQLNVSTVCLTATVTDGTGQPVAGVLVTFHVSGLGPLTGFGYTDANGVAQFCYSRTGTVPGQDTVVAEISLLQSNTVLVNWTTGPPCDNPVTGGTIGNDQLNCSGFVPAPLVSLSLPSGQNGTLEYLWQQSTVSSTAGFADLPGTNSLTLAPGMVNQTTWYKRLARVDCKSGWLGAAESNVVEIRIDNPLPVGITISTPANRVCEGTTVVVVATGYNGGTNPVFSWEKNGSVTGSGTPVLEFIPANGDEVRCWLTSSSGCTTANPAVSNPLVFAVDPKETPALTLQLSPVPVCEGAPVHITATTVNGGTNPLFRWTLQGKDTVTTQPDLSLIPSNGDTVFCTMTSDFPCLFTPDALDTVVAVVIDPIRIVDTLVCYGTPYFAQGQWQTQPGIYTDTLPQVVDCKRILRTTLRYKPAIPLNLGQDTVICRDDFALDATVPGASYTWQDGTTTPVYMVRSSGLYYVTVRYDECEASDTVYIGECERPPVFPDAFTPNGDGINDYFHPYAKEVDAYSLLIFNRWGEQIFETRTIDPGWDGKSGGQACPADVYAFTASYRMKSGAEGVVRGTVILVK